MSKVKRSIIILFTFFLISGCVSTPSTNTEKKGNVYYEVFVRSFYDSDLDGYGDLKGVSEKLPYLDEFGISGLWLMPIMPSSSYHKYDVDDYQSIDESYGSMEDFEELVSRAKEKNIDIIIDLVLNHTSNDIDWFTKAKESLRNDTCEEENSYCDYYHFSKVKEANYYPVPGTDYFYEGVFSSEMPDLNLDSENVRNEISKIVAFWMNKGIKGFRLDAIMHFYNMETKLNVEFLTWLNNEVHSLNKDAFIVGEAWTSNTIVDNYYTSGISCFDFDFAGVDGKIASYIKKGNGDALASQISEHQSTLKRINSTAIESIFLSNHDQGRSASYFFNSALKTKLMAATYLLMPGIPFVYYGEEIGLQGSGKDENKRLAFIWDNNNKHECLPIENNDYPKVDIVGLKKQSKDQDSLYNYYKKVINIRNKHSSLVDGEIVKNDQVEKSLYSLESSNKEERIMVMHNFSDQSIEVDVPNNYQKISDQISPSNELSSIKDNKIMIPAYSSLILE